MAPLADKEQALVGTVGIRGMSTHRAGFACIVCVYLDGHRPLQERLVGNIAVQFGKAPFGVGGIGMALLVRSLFASASLGPFSDMGQVFQTDEALWVLVYDAFGDHMIGVLLQPSLSSDKRDESPGGRTSAFLLQTLSQSRIMVRLLDNALSCIEGTCSLGGRGHSQIAHAYINTCHPGLGLWGWVCYLDRKRDEQVEVLLGFVVPQPGRPNLCSCLQECHVFAIACVGHDHPAIQGQDAHLLLRLQAVVPMKVVGERWGDIRGSCIQALVALLGRACFACSSVLLHLRPERLVGGSDLAGDVAGHLGRYAILQAYLIVAIALQGTPTAHLAVRKCIARDVVQGIPIGQLRLSQGLELLRCRMQVQLGCHELFHTSSIADIHTSSNTAMVRESLRQFLPTASNPEDSLARLLKGISEL